MPLSLKQCRLWFAGLRSRDRGRLSTAGRSDEREGGVRAAHGRERFAGPREVLVAMADAVHLPDCSPTIEVTAS